MIRFFNEGYKDGFAHGRIHGLIEGRALGREKGFEMWEELAFYEGFASVWKAIYDKRGVDDEYVKSLDPSLCSDRTDGTFTITARSFPVVVV